MFTVVVVVVFQFSNHSFEELGGPKTKIQYLCIEAYKNALIKSAMYSITIALKVKG